MKQICYLARPSHHNNSGSRSSILTAITIIFFSCLSSKVSAQIVDLRIYQQTTRSVIENARRMIEPVLSVQQRSIARNIEYRVTSEHGIGAFAANEFGRPVIVVSAGTVQVMEWFFDAITMETQLGKTGCFKQYLGYLQSIVSENQMRVANQIPPKPAAAPALYGNFSSNSCSGTTQSDFMRVPDLAFQRAKEMEASIMFLYLHELGHHVLGHTSEAQSNSPRTLGMTREQEDKADEFAVLTALKARYFLMVATPWHSLMAALGGNSIEAENKSDHPLGMRRVFAVFDRTVNYLRTNPGAWPDPSNFNQVMTELAAARDDLKMKVSNIQ